MRSSTTGLEVIHITKTGIYYVMTTTVEYSDELLSQSKHQILKKRSH